MCFRGEYKKELSTFYLQRGRFEKSNADPEWDNG